MPFVVVKTSVFAFGPCGELARRGSDVEAVDHDGVALAADDRVVAELVAQPPRLVDLRAAEDALVARCERLCDRRRRAHDVDDDADAGCGFLLRREGDVNAHVDTLARWTSPVTATAIRTGRPVSRAPNAVARSATSA